MAINQISDEREESRNNQEYSVIEIAFRQSKRTTETSEILGGGNRP